MTTLDIGLWEEDVDADCIRGDAVMARMFGLFDAEVTEGISRAHLMSIFHPEDVVQDPELSRSVREEGGLFVWEHRILPEPGIVRWVLARGHYERDTKGRMLGRGIVIDVTDSRTDGQLDGPAHFLAAFETSGAVLERIADRAIEACELIRTLDAASSGRMRLLIDALLKELGQQIAASLQDEPPAPEQPQGQKVH
ncbi:PAS domain-containing protein [Methylobacterium sp. J-048]|uniref:PAS domain-containing protein n=1 Tax=Methylobacterium sp. J-048 TaxID=2836635 RepID=UPI001FBBCE38|nr:PAS domain-containing protein [Methylobacterium sp. J-048]MCJ2058891.1 PAS domain-containing protein [Methylobacterium sp. J-048]